MNSTTPRPGRAVDATYDPWQDLATSWPEVEVLVRPLPGRLLGVLQFPTIVLRAGTSAAQRRCTLTHELVHLERGVRDCGPWAAREELHVELEVSARLLPLPVLARAITAAGGSADLPALAQLADVDLAILSLRLERLSAAERSALWSDAVRDLWSVA